ncbi:type-1 restriction enzyme EcoKI specificity protein [Serratia marcescens]|nr:type-1 restriction enzyme EcoKI specificity protein [Serratia marcescens]
MSAGKLPEEWGETKIGEIADVISGGTPKSGIAENFAPSGDGIAWLTPADLSGYKEKSISHGARDLSTQGYSSCSAKLMPAGAILFSSRAPIGYVAVASNEISTNQGFKSFVFTNDIYPDYAYYYLRNIRHLAEEMGTGTTFKEISGSAAKTLSFVMAPIAEQKIIAEKLDTLLAQVDSTKARLEQIPQILKRFRQAVLAAAVSGKLTNASRNSHSLIDWYSTNLGALIVDSCNGLAKRQGLNGNEITILRLADFKDAQRIIGNERKIKLDTKEENKYSLADNDILVIRVNGSADLAGRFIEYKSTGDIEGFCDHFIRLRLDSNKIMSRFLTYIANEGEGRFYLRNSLSTSAGQNTINQTSIKGLSFLLPPLEEQHEIVRRVEQLFAYADTIEKQVNSALTRVNSLTQSILAKAFRGELTAQWRAENPDLISGENSAAALLEKIKAERAASGGKKTARKKA